MADESRIGGGIGADADVVAVERSLSPCSRVQHLCGISQEDGDVGLPGGQAVSGLLQLRIDVSQGFDDGLLPGITGLVLDGDGLLLLLLAQGVEGEEGEAAEEERSSVHSWPFCL